MAERIIQFKEERNKRLKQKTSIVSALLKMREIQCKPESKRSKLEITHINCEVRHLLSESRNLFHDQTGESIGFEIGPSDSNLNDVFGILSEKETSSDEISMDETEQAVKMGENKGGEKGLRTDLRRYKFRTESINGIIPLPNHHAWLLGSDTVYMCNLNKDDFNARAILSGVHQFAHIPASGDVLCIMVGYREIKRISNGNIVTRFVCITNRSEELTSVSSGGNEAYACASEERQWWQNSYLYTVNLLNESGVVLKKFDFASAVRRNSWDRGLIQSAYKNICIRGKKNNVELIDLQQCKTIKSYDGSIGPNPGSRFCIMGMTTDSQNNILLAAHNDDAIHLLDESLKFQKLLMTAEDGLHGLLSVALDSDGYLWVGCEDGQIHRVNYQYLLNTDRQTRLKLKQMAV
jgi:hypothetical protein